MNDKNSPFNEKGKVTLPTESQEETMFDVPSLPKKDEQDPVDTSIIDEQWASLSQDWQSQHVEKTDIKALLQQTKKRTLWAKSVFGLNVLATVGLLFSFIHGVFNNEFGKPINIYLGVGGLLSLVFVYYEVKIRAATWRKISESPDKAIENAIVGCESSLRYMSLTKWSCLPFSILANWFVYAAGKESDKSIMPAFIFINACIVVMFIITEVIHRKRKREFKELSARSEN